MFRSLIVAGAMMWAGIAAAQEPPNEDGIGPYRFGMSVGDARGTAPNALWTVVQQGEAQVLSGGPRVAIGGRLDAALVFIEDRTQRIVLLGTTTGACVNAVAAMVETVEPLYGAFTSVAPHSLEGGALREVSYTELGSEIRWREGEGARFFATSARHGRMYVIVRGDPEDAACRVTLTLGSETDWPREEATSGPTWAQIDAARSLPTPEYTRRPSAQSFARHYPYDALSSGISGVVALDCLVLENTTLDCRVAEESPPGRGFGPAGIAIGRDFRVRTTNGEESIVGRRLRVPVRFNVAR